jgi:hypothetical protein
MTDTSPEIEKKYREMLMSRSNSERFMMGIRMFDVARSIVLSSFPPNLSDLEKKRRLCERFYGDEVDVEAFMTHLAKLNPDA